LAIGHVTFSNPNPLTLVRGHALQKGDVLAVARIAAITAAKKTSDWIPLCHSGVPVEGIKVRVEGVDGHDAAEKTTPSASSSPVTHKQPEHPSSQRIDSTAEKVADDEGDGETQVQQYEQTLFATPLPPYGGVRISVRVDTTAKTGVEMEALVGVVGAGLTIVDMCKGVDRGLVLEGVRVVGKKGGRSGSWGVWGGKD
jgi:cyclic pyranopterin phosphate synthase